MTNASRAQVDLDAFARDLRHDDPTGQGSGKADPLAELARIVGQDDPFRALLAARDQMRAVAPAEPQAGWNGRVEPSFAAEPVKASPADAFDQYLASVERDTHQEVPYAHGGEAASEAGDETYADDRPLRRTNPRRRLVSVGAGIAVVAVAVTGALTYKGMNSGGHSGVPVVQADSTPLKVAPKVADGVEIPDQNRQIYDPKGKKEGQIKIVNREEQPLDVAEAARAVQGPTVAASSQGGTTPGNGPFEAFGEPRRVRTVAVKPEAPPAAPVRETPADAGPSPIPTMVLPGDEPAPPPASKAKPTRQAAASIPQPTPAPVEAPPAPAPVEAPPPKPVAVKPPPKAAQRVATAGPASIPDTTASTTTDDAALRSGPVGGFAVQLGVRGSAAEARAALHEMQGKYSQLAGKPELIRQAEVGGKTIFRVRVGPLQKAEASSLCSAVQGAGGQCFVAKN